MEGYLKSNFSLGLNLLQARKSICFSTSCSLKFVCSYYINVKQYVLHLESVHRTPLVAYTGTHQSLETNSEQGCCLMHLFQSILQLQFLWLFPSLTPKTLISTGRDRTCYQLRLWSSQVHLICEPHLPSIQRIKGSFYWLHRKLLLQLKHLWNT